MHLWLYCLGGLLYDWLVYVVWTVIPIRAVSLEASPTQLGLLQTVSTVIYILGCLLAGPLADRGSRSFLARLGCVGAILACLAIARTRTLAGLYLTVPILALGGSLFWPTVQAAIGRETRPERIEKAIGLFNVFWSTGKGIGFLTAGWMVGKLGSVTALWSAALAALAIFFLYPWGDGPRAQADAAGALRERFTFRLLAYVANFFAFGVGSTLHIQIYKYLAREGLGTTLGRESFFGIFLGTVFLAQTATFFFMQRGRSWAYRRAPLYLAQVLLAASAGTLPFLRTEFLLLALAPGIGVGLGFCNASSIYYSLHGPAEHGKYSGIHEAVLGAGNIALPLLGGVLADGTGDLRTPYWLAAAAGVAAVTVEETVYRTRSRS